MFAKSWFIHYLEKDTLQMIGLELVLSKHRRVFGVLSAFKHKKQILKKFIEI